MIIGVPKEIKTEEFRVGLTPFGVQDLKHEGHTLLIESGAGVGSGFPDSEYQQSGADIVEKEQLFSQAELIVKVKEPLPPEYGLLKNNQALFTYLHLAPNRELTEVLLRKQVTALGYETLSRDNALPLLSPMSEIAGRMAPLMGAYYLQKFKGGSGILVTGASSVKPARIVILGGGAAGKNAARVASQLGMKTTVIDKEMARLQKIDEMFMGVVKTLPATAQSIAGEIRDADIVVGAVLVPGGKTPVLITRQLLRTMKKGSVIVDVSVDQGGCIETSRPTTHDDPVYEVDGIIHYCVANMPGAYPRTSTLALTNATLPYIHIIAGEGIKKAVQEDPIIRSALNTYQGKIVNKPLAEAMGFTTIS
jgi:alanine dehydrogenase